MVDGIDGISGRDDVDASDTDEVNSIDDVVQAIEGVESEKDIIDLLAEADNNTIVDGVQRHNENDETSRQQRRTITRVQQKSKQEELLQKQLSELQDVDGNTSLLRRVAANIATTNSRLNGISTTLSLILDKKEGDVALTVKDFGNSKISEANVAEKVVEKSDIATTKVIVKAPSTNQGSLFVGTSGVEVDDGFLIEAGEEEEFPIDVDKSQFQIAAGKSGDSYTYLALGKPT